MSDRRLGHCKLCELADFSDPELRDLIRDVYSADLREVGDDFPKGWEYRKYWEVAMTLRAFRHLGLFRDDAQVLGVGAGHEATLYWLTRVVGKVVATDLYATDDSWSQSDSGSEMLVDPGQFWDEQWNPERLEVKHMSGLDLQFPDESFDAIFSSSSIEHFGGWEDVRRGVEEMHRVLKPGGVVALATEFRLEGPTMGMAGALVFDEPELRSLLMDGLWWDPVTPLETEISPETVATEVSFREALKDSERGQRWWSRYPHLVLRDGDLQWTSVHVALVKSRGSTAEWRRRSLKARPPRHSRQPRPGVRQRAEPVLAPLARLRRRISSSRSG